MAISVNGIIARKNNDEDFLSQENWNTFLEFARQHRNVIWGRKTYEVVRNWGDDYLKDIKNFKKIIVSKNANFNLEENFELVSSPEDALKKLKNESFKTALVAGGSTLNTSFANNGLLDEIILNVNSVILGQGIPLFSSEDFTLKLELLGTKNITKDIIQLHYKVVK